MTEAMILGVVTALGALAANYAKTHPFYKYKTQKLKEQYLAKAMNAFHRQPNKHQHEIYFYSMAVTDFVFDFNKRLHHDYHVERLMSQVHAEKNMLYKYQIEFPNVLCEQIIRRAVEVKAPISLFTHHMRDLWMIYLVPVGKLTPNTLNKIPGAESYIAALLNLPTTKEQINKYLELHVYD